MAKDKKGKKHKKVKLILILFLIILIVAPIIKAETNYKHNALVAENFLIFNSEGYIQNQPATSVFKYGFNTSDNSGCGWIATYNVLKYLYNNGKYPIEPQIEDVIKPLDQFGAFGFGFLGTNPLAISLLLKTKGLNTKIITKQSKFYEEAKNADISIMVYVSKKLSYGHYQMVKYNDIGDDFIFYTPGSVKLMTTYISEHKENDLMFLITVKA